MIPRLSNVYYGATLLLLNNISYGINFHMEEICASISPIWMLTFILIEIRPHFLNTTSSLWFNVEVIEGRVLILSGREMRIRNSDRVHTPHVGLTFEFSLLHFKKHTYTIFLIVRLVRYTCKLIYYKQQYYNAYLLLFKMLT